MALLVPMPEINNIPFNHNSNITRAITNVFVCARAPARVCVVCGITIKVYNSSLASQWVQLYNYIKCKKTAVL